MKRVSVLCLFVLALTQGCKQSKKVFDDESISPYRNPVSVTGTRFVDSYGRQVIFNGINKVNKDPGMNYTDIDSSGYYKMLDQLGLNCIRLGVIWDGVEHEPGKYDEKYLDKIEESVNRAARNGLYVLLDMHQDLYGVSFGEGKTTLGDGAPEWATITDNQPHLKGRVWSESYLISPAVQKAFDNFWANKPASDGVGIRDHYAKMWQHVAKRFSDNKAVIGYDIMNEPFNGTPGTYILPRLVTGYAMIYAEETGKVLSEKEVNAIFSDDDRKLEALSGLNTREKYSRFVDAAKELNQEFEKTHLQSMYQQVGDAIRDVDTNHIIFLEHSYFGNMGVSTAIEPIRRKDGERDPLVAYAPHVYDLLVDTKEYEKTDNSRVDVMISRIRQTSERLNCPVLVGEWGAFPGRSEAILSSARFITGLFDKYCFGNTYWGYGATGKDFYIKNVLVRPYPAYVGGSLEGYGFDNKTSLFSCSWNESPQIKAPTMIFIPDLDKLSADSIILSPGGGKFEIQSIKESKAGYIIIPVSGGSLTRRIEFRTSI